MRRKIIALFRRPLNDVSHFGIITVILLALLSGISATYGTDEKVSVNPFVTETTDASSYQTSREKRTKEADTVAIVASIYSQDLGSDAYTATETIYQEAASSSTVTGYIASVPIVKNAASDNSGNKAIDYVVQAGDTLSTIASKYGVTTDTVRYANNITEIDNIQPGDTLTVPPVTGIMHTVTSGETVASIASKY